MYLNSLAFQKRLVLPIIYNFHFCMIINVLYAFSSSKMLMYHKIESTMAFNITIYVLVHVLTFKVFLKHKQMFIFSIFLLFRIDNNDERYFQYLLFQYLPSALNIWGFEMDRRPQILGVSDGQKNPFDEVKHEVLRSEQLLCCPMITIFTNICQIINLEK